MLVWIILESKDKKIFSHCIFHFQWHLLSFGKPEPWSKSSKHCIRLHCSLWLWSGIATIWSCIVLIWSGIFCNLNVFMLKTSRPWTMWRATRWWWPRPGNYLTSSWGRSSPTSSGSPACTSWRSVDQNTYCWERLPRLHIYHETLNSFPGLPFPLWRGLCSSKGLTIYKEVQITCLSIKWFTWSRFSTKIQQLKESGLISLWIRQEQDLVAQRAEGGPSHHL